MNGAQSLIRTLVDGDVDVCFANPGTSEMHFVAALDDVPQMRAILALFEGAATGAADGYSRVADKPAATLLHLGPGLGNGLANLHNARRAHSPVVNIVGDHATYHKRFDAPLESDIESLASAVSQWYRMSMRPDDIAADAADAIAAALGPPSGVATLVLPADVSWNESSVGPAVPHERRRPALVSPDSVEEIAKVLKGAAQGALLLGGSALRPVGLVAASRICQTTKAKMLGETFPRILARGAGLPAVDRLGYLAEFAEAQLAGVDHLIVVDTHRPVSFFAYPDRPSDLVPAGCTVHHLCPPGTDVTAALEALAEAVGATDTSAVTAPAHRPAPPSGPLTMESVAQAIGALLPEGAVVVDEANTAGLFIPGTTAGAPRHDWITLSGGAIGQGMPAATGAAVADGARPVISLEADGSAMYTLQSLWTQAREQLDVTTLIFSNRSYAILNLELNRVGAEGGGEKAGSMLDLSRPDLDFVALAQGMGVPAVRVSTADDLVTQLSRSLAESGPSLIEIPLPAGL